MVVLLDHGNRWHTLVVMLFAPPVICEKLLINDMKQRGCLHIYHLYSDASLLLLFLPGASNGTLLYRCIEGPRF